MKAHLKTYGCQMNVQDSLQMKGLLAKQGYDHTDNASEADMVLLVTCSIREKAVDKVYSDLGRIREMLPDNPNMVVGVSGCVAQQEKENLFKRFPFVDMVFGPDAVSELPTMLKDARDQKQKGFKSRILKTKFHHKKDFEFVNLLYDGEENRVKAYVNIQKGCDNVCAFCIVPRVRGAEVSRPSSQIIDEIKALVDLGVKDVTLLGQNVNSYGLKDTGEVTFAQLLEKIAKETNLAQLRFTTSHPKDVGDDLVEQFKNLSILAPHFHLPVQSGSDRILQAMRRQYDTKHYLTVVEKLKKVRPDIVFTTDFIVGFPGETAEDFEATINLLHTVGYDLSFSFTYSPRPGTTALRLEDNVSEEVKKERLDILLNRQRQVSGANNAKLLDTQQTMLVENYSAENKTWFGRTGTNKIVHLQDENPKRSLTGEFVKVKVIKANPHSLIAEAI
ncbi:tRNA (N6-isopentenyl adenosine(37)-C2)-methylthiotransferase MiaB [bacterium]|nr:tRNA (N6-isopentenyl adenosine(37)-C2)-methylthiotransferase MiaB [bacterium]